MCGGGRNGLLPLLRLGVVMSLHQEFETVAALQGWSEDHMLALICEYLEFKKLDKKFLEMLELAMDEDSKGRRK